MNHLIDGVCLNAGGGRNYGLYVATSRDGEDTPLFVMVHGCRQNGADIAAGTRRNELAEEFGGVVLYRKRCQMANVNGCWTWHEGTHQNADWDEPSLIAGMTRHVTAERGIEPARLYVAGMSAGGAMAVILGQEFPDLYAAVGVHSGVLWGVVVDLISAFSVMNSGPAAALAGSMRTPIRGKNRVTATIVFHGDCDTMVHPSNGEAIHARARRPARRVPVATASATSRANGMRVRQGRRGRVHVQVPGYGGRAPS